MYLVAKLRGQLSDVEEQLSSLAGVMNTVAEEVNVLRMEQKTIGNAVLASGKATHEILRMSEEAYKLMNSRAGKLAAKFGGRG